ncbi:Protein containing two CBS domains (some fused to C-terminal double-stranded RNA-binding domain of RaiA family) [Halapricum desulfuricans]|uniref:Protein containing two CBS domains (Some fused to C-terminal double-stranded RNA-binding domain of RaiA family) n=1 Tax=Halapricum desulfuricans TaxID=2841257 RepID=A0A897NEB7_9EURY|nr:CBS domain-containing protein [Halapricum desulfuricans]QSG08726.1 Protein containing two CBS domains (some fused to C-terminal double-stranded RNA-binding domain of RaiA family) [Halapricum desulfuricans]
MDIANIVSDDYVQFPPDSPVSKLVGTFDDPAVKGVVVRDDRFRGIVTRRQLATSHRQPGPTRSAGTSLRAPAGHTAGSARERVNWPGSWTSRSGTS